MVKGDNISVQTLIGISLYIFNGVKISEFNLNIIALQNILFRLFIELLLIKANYSKE